MEEGSMSIALQLMLLVLLIAINAFFALAEMAIVSVNKNKIRTLAEEGNQKALALEEMLSEPTNFLSTIQVAITLAGFFSSASAATGLTHHLSNVLEAVNVSPLVADNIALFIITLILAFFTLVFGELVPKRVALQNAEKFSLAVIKPILFLSKVATPFVKLLSFSTNIVLRILGMDIDEIEEKVTEEEIRSLVAVGEEMGVFNETEKDMIESIFLFDDKLAKEIMTARTDVYMIDAGLSEKEFLEEVIQSPYSRIPVYEEDIDNIIGILYIKDLLKEAFSVGFENVKIREIMKEAYFVPERKNIDILFKELQDSNLHIAVLVDEYGGFSGIVTIEDMIEEVMGEIEDEYDESDPEYVELGKNHYKVKGLMTISDLNAALSLQLDTETDDFDTIGGYLIHHIGHIPNESETEQIDIDNYSFIITGVKENRIDELEIIIRPERTDEELLLASDE